MVNRFWEIVTGTDNDTLYKRQDTRQPISAKIYEFPSDVELVIFYRVGPWRISTAYVENSWSSIFLEESRNLGPNFFML